MIFNAALQCGPDGEFAVTLPSLLALLPFLLGMAAFQGPAGGTVTRVWVQEELIVRVPVRPRPRALVEWEEDKGPRCIAEDEIIGASSSGRDHVDFVLADRRRLRATFDEDCPALDFYGGFYLKLDGENVCARRDFIYSRVGGSCRIDRFNALTPRIRR